MKVRTLAITLSAILSALAIVLIADAIAQKLLLNVDEKVVVKECRRAIDRQYIADEKGNVCKWQEINYSTGCCNVPTVNSCDFCAVNCCSVYAYCVSCCMQPTNVPLSEISPEFADKFDFCRTTCRSSSRSLINENQWKSENKYCFPTISESDENQSNNNSQVDLNQSNNNSQVDLNQSNNNSQVDQNQLKNKEEDQNEAFGKEDGFEGHVVEVQVKYDMIQRSREYENNNEDDDDTVIAPQNNNQNPDYVVKKLEQIYNLQRDHKEMLEHLEDQISKLVEQNQKLTDENKNLLYLLEEHRKEIKHEQELHLIELMEREEKQRRSTSSCLLTAKSIFYIALSLFVYLYM